MAWESCNLKVVFFPFMAHGHILPIIDMAKLFAARGVESIILTTPGNAPSIQPSIDAANDPLLGLHLIPFPSPDDTGLPEGCESVSSLPSPRLVNDFFKAVSLLREPFSAAVGSLAPNCVVTDMFFPWTYAAASELGVPRLVFHGYSFFSLCVSHSLSRHRSLENLPDDPESSFIIEDIPHKIRMFKSQYADPEKSVPALKQIFLATIETDTKNYGTILNSFYELEPEYAQHFRSNIGRAWHVGPLALHRSGAAGGASTEDEERPSCLGWLDGRRPGSVLYVCFGSVSKFSDEQLREIALGLEAAGRPFLWVVRKEGSEWLPEGFEERTSNWGLIVRGWAPQTAILNHEAVGGFVTHCGWNSCLEGITAGLPMVTWPMFADQFYNEMLMVDVLGIGVGVGVKESAMESTAKVMVESGKLTEAVVKVMGEGDEAEERRRKGKELGEMAKKAVEVGGSSYVDLSNLIEELMMKRRTKNAAAS